MRVLLALVPLLVACSEAAPADADPDTGWTWRDMGTEDPDTASPPADTFVVDTAVAPDTTHPADTAVDTYTPPADTAPADTYVCMPKTAGGICKTGYPSAYTSCGAASDGCGGSVSCSKCPAGSWICATSTTWETPRCTCSIVLKLCEIGADPYGGRLWDCPDGIAPVDPRSVKVAQPGGTYLWCVPPASADAGA